MYACKIGAGGAHKKVSAVKAEISFGITPVILVLPRALQSKPDV